MKQQETVSYSLMRWSVRYSHKRKHKERQRKTFIILTGPRETCHKEATQGQRLGGPREQAQPARQEARK